MAQFLRNLSIGILLSGIQIAGFGQSVTLSIGSGPGTAGTTVSLPITLASSGGAQAAGLDWSFVYSSDITNVTVVAGPSATNAGKSVTCSANHCLVFGLNNTAIADGTVATATFQIASSPSSLAIPIQISGAVATTADGNSISSSGGSGTITLPPPADTSAPVISITSPTSGGTFAASSTTINVSGTASDNVGVTQITWATNRGSSGIAAGTTSWQISGLGIQTGSTTLTVTAHDAAGNAANTVLTMTYTPPDTAAPVISITSPTSASTFTASSTTINLGGTASDNVGVTQVTWATDHGGSGTAAGTSSWLVSGLVIQPGSTTVTVTAHDAAGNIASSVLAVTYTPTDTVAPAISIASPTSGPTFTASGSTISLSGTASDNVGVTQITWLTDRGGSGAAAGTASWTINGLALLPGSNAITVTAHDAAGNVASSVLTVTYSPSDTISPVINITSPTSSPAFAAPSSTINLGGTASDNVGVTQITWVTDRGNSGTASGTSSWAIGGLVIQPGSTTITVTAHDAAGNIGTSTLAIVYSPGDVIAPTISIGSPTSGATFTASSSTISLSGTASDNVGVTQVTWATDHGDTGVALGTSNWAANAVPIQPGSTVVTVTAHDAAGNVTSSALAVTYSPSDLVPPGINITSPTANPTFTSANNSIDLSGTASDNVGVTAVTWVTDHGATGTATGTTNWTINGLVLLPGRTVVTVTAHDSAGNVTSAVLAITCTISDTTAPGIHITSPTAASSYATSLKTVALAGTASDDVGIAQVTWASDRGGTGAAIGTTSWSIASVPLQNGVNNITVTARDGGGNLTSTTLMVTCTGQDAVSIVITSPTTHPTISATQNSVSLGGTASNSATQITWLTDQGYQGPAVGTSIWTTNGIPLRNGTNRITMVARDAAGNQSTAGITIVVNAPAIMTVSLPVAEAGKYYSFKLAAVGGTPPYLWSASPVPNGLTMNGDGLIAGTPEVSGKFTPNISVQDSVQTVTTVAFNLEVDTWLSMVSAASLTQGPVAPESMVAVFGWQLADVTDSTTASPLAVKLDETTVTVRDANGVERNAGLYYISSPQINFTIPAGTAPGPATVVVSTKGQVRATGTLNIVPVAPALFFVNQDMLAAAGVVRVKGDQTSYEPVVKAQGIASQLVSVPIDLGSDTDQVYLTLYGTGLRNRSGLDGVHVFVANVLVPVAYAGPSGIFDDLDLVNVLLPKTLRGAGASDVFVMVDNVAANTVRVVIQ